MEYDLLNKIKKVFTVDNFINSKTLHYRNHLNMNLSEINVNTINSKYSRYVFEYIKRDINEKLIYPILTVKIKENSNKESIIYLEASNKFKSNDFKIISSLLSNYSKNLNYNLIKLDIKTDKVYNIINIKSLQEIFLGKSFEIKIDIFSRNNYFISKQIYEYINLLITKGELLLCFGRDVIIPSSININFKHIKVISHKQNIINEISDNRNIEAVHKNKNEYHLVLNNINKNLDITVFISSGRKGLNDLFIEELSKFKKLKIIVIWCVIDELLRDYQKLVNIGFTLKNCNVFNEHPCTNYLTSILNFQK